MNAAPSSQVTDPFPSRFTIEIDRVRLRKFMRTGRLLLCFLPLAIFLPFFAFILAMGHVERGGFPWDQSVWIVLRWTGTGIGAAALIGSVIYLIFNHHQSYRFAESLEVSVEGAFLRIRQGGSVTSDRRIHFRSIVDYTCYQTRLMRFFGVHSLRMITPGAGPGAMLDIAGIKDCLRIRDMLSEIDSLRENQ